MERMLNAQVLRKTTNHAKARAAAAAEEAALELCSGAVGDKLWALAEQGEWGVYLTGYSTEILDALGEILKLRGFKCARNEAGVPYLYVSW